MIVTMLAEVEVVSGEGMRGMVLDGKEGKA